jgi:aryl-alcohol dehydrogenase-like predicted oxidoreductase
MIHSFNRRNFIGLATLGAGALAIEPVSVSADDVNNFETVQLTKEIKCSRIGFGTGMRGSQRQSDFTRAGWNKGIEMLRYAYDRGIRLFDCADAYGTHLVVAEALKDKPRDSYVIVTKVWLNKGGAIPEQERLDPQITVKRLLRELRTEYIDVLQLHCLYDTQWTTIFAEAMESMEKLKQQGVIRAHGVSSHSNAVTELAAKTAWCDVIHVRLNSEGMNMDGPKDDVAKRVEQCVQVTKQAHDAGKGIIAMKLIGEGKMSNDLAMRKKSIKFVKELDCVDAMIVGFTETEHITEFLQNVAG